MRATDITATIARPVDQYGTDWNWADAGREAWLLAAEAAGLVIEDETWDGVGQEYGCTRVRVAGTWYEVELRALDEVRAVEITKED